jgi:hypothetical protein
MGVSEPAALASWCPVLKVAYNSGGIGFVAQRRQDVLVVGTGRPAGARFASAPSSLPPDRSVQRQNPQSQHGQCTLANSLK